MLVSAIALGIVAGVLFGGDIRRLATLRVTALPLVVAAVSVRAVSAALGLPWPAYCVALLAIAAAAVWNRHLPGMLLIAAGVLMNSVVIALNGGMPVSEAAARAAGATFVEDGLHVPLHAATTLPWLADVLPVALVRNVYSIGDVLLAAGGFWLPFTWLRRA